MMCYMCDQRAPVELHDDGFHYHGKIRCSSRPWQKPEPTPEAVSVPASRNPRVLLGVTGGVAAKLTPKLVLMLLKEDIDVQVVTTEKALYFFKTIDRPGDVPTHLFHDNKIINTCLWTDEDEWTGVQYEKNQDIPHISLTQWADVFAIVPATANTIAKMAWGICDNLLTSEVVAWPTGKPMVMAPAMNTVMWNNPIVKDNLRILHGVYSTVIVPPVCKRLACGDVGEGALADLSTIVRVICDQIERNTDTCECGRDNCPANE